MSLGGPWTTRVAKDGLALVRICKPLQRPDWRQILLQTSFGGEFFALSPKRRLMNTYVSLILTTIVTISTIIYTCLLDSIWANHSGSSRDIPAGCSRQSLGRTEPLPWDLTAARRSRNRFSAEGIGSVVGIHDRQSADPRYRKRTTRTSKNFAARSWP